MQKSIKLKNLMSNSKPKLPIVISVMFFVLAVFSANAASITWTGTTSTDWATTTNWSPSALPTSADAVVIPTSPSGGRMPTYSTGTTTVTSVTIQAGATLTITGGSLTTTAAFDIFGTATQSGGTLAVKDLKLSAVDAVYNQSGASSVVSISHDYKNTGGTFNSTGGLIKWTGSIAAGGGAQFNLGTNQFYNVEFNGSLDPGINNDANSYFSVAGNFTCNNSIIDFTSLGSTVNFNGSGTTQTISGSAMSILNNVILSSGATVNLSADMVVSGNWTNNGTTFSFGAYSVSFSGTGKTIGGSVATTFGSLIITTGTITVNKDISCSALTLTNDVVANSLTLGSSLVTLTVGGDVTINQASANAVVHSLNVNEGTVNVGGNVNMNVTANNGGRIIKIAITSGSMAVNGNLTMSNTLLAANSVIDMSGGGGSIYLKGAFNVTNLGTMTPGTSSTFIYNGTSDQNVTYKSAIAYNHLKIDKTSGTASLSANTIIGGDMILQNSILSANSYNLTVGGNWTNNGGNYSGGSTTVTFQGASSTIGGTTGNTFPNLVIDDGANYTMSTNNTVSSLTFSVANTTSGLTHSGTSTLTVNGTVTLNHPVKSVTAGWNINAGSSTVSGLISFPANENTATRVAKITITTGTLNANGGITFSGTGNAAASRVIDMSGSAGIINLKGALTFSAVGTLTAGTAGSVFNYNDVAAQTVSKFSAGGYHNLYINNTNANGASLVAAMTSSNITGNISVQSGTFDNGGFAVGMANSKTFEVSNGATFKLGGTSAMVTGTSITKIFGTSSTVNYYGNTQNVSGETYGNLIISGSLTKTLVGTATTNGTLTLSAGTFSLGANTLNINGAISTTSGTLSGGCTSNIVIGGSGASTTLPTVTANNFTMNRAAGISISGNLSVCGTLTFTQGIITTDANNVYIQTGGSVSRTSGHVNGNLKKYITTGATSKTFEVGGGSSYRPVSIVFGNVTVAGDLTAKSTLGDHLQITSSTVSILKSASCYWTLTNSGITFNNYSATFTFVSTDVDAAANTGNFKVGQYVSSAWSYPTVGTKTSTSTQATGLTSFGDFQCGENGSNVIIYWDGGASTNNWGDANNWNPNGVPTSADIVLLNGANTINANVDASAGDLTLNNSGLVLTIKSGKTLTATSMTITDGTLKTENAFPTVSGSLAINGGTVEYSKSSGSQTVVAKDYVNLSISGGGTKTLSADITPSGNLSVSGGTFDLSTYTANRASSGGTFTLSNDAVVRVGGTNTRPLNYSTHSVSSNSTIEYYGSDQLVKALNSSQSYGILTLSGSGTKTLETDISVNEINIPSGVTLASGNHNMTVSGNWTNNGSFDAGIGAAVIFSGTSVISGTSTNNFFGVTITGILTAPSGNLSVSGDWVNNGTFTHNSGTVLFNGNTSFSGSGSHIFNNITITGTLTAPSSTLFIEGTLTNNGVFNHNNGTINFASITSQTIPALQYYNLSGSEMANRTFATNVSVGIEGTFTPGNNTFTTTGSTLEFNGSGDQTIPALTYYHINTTTGGTKTLGGNVTVNGLMTVGENTTLNLSNRTVTLKCNNCTPIVNNGTFNAATSTVTYYGYAINQAIAELNYYNLNLPYGESHKFGNGTTSVGGSLTGSYWTIDARTNNSTIEYNGSGSQSILPMYYHNLKLSGSTNKTGSTIHIAGTFDPGSQTSFNSGTVDFNGSDNQNIPAGFNYYNLSLTSSRNTAGTTKTLQGNINVNGDLSVTDYTTLEMGSNTISRTVTGGKVNIGASSILKTSGDLPTNYTTYKFDSNSKIVYNSSGSQTIRSLDYYNLTSENGGSRTFSGDGTTTIKGILTPGSSTFTSATNSTVNFNGSSQNIPACSFYNLVITGGTKTLTGNVNVSNDFTANTSIILSTNTISHSGGVGNTFSIATGKTMYLAGEFPKDFGTYTLEGTVNFNGTNLQSAQTIPALNYFNLTCSSSTSGVPMGDRILASSDTIKIRGAFKPAKGTYTTTDSKIKYSGTALQSLPSFTYNDLIISNSSGVKAGSTYINGKLFLDKGIVTGNVYVLNSNTNAVTVNNGFVNGNFQRITSDPGNYLFPVGGAISGYRPITVGSNAVGEIYTIKLQNNNPSLNNYNTDSIGTNVFYVNTTYFWYVRRSASTTPCSLVFNYDEVDFAGHLESNLILTGWNKKWLGNSGVLNQVNNTITITGVNTFTPFTLASNSSEMHKTEEIKESLYEESTKNLETTVYPNPAIQNVNITIDSKEEGVMDVKLYSLTGTVVAEYAENRKSGLQTISFDVTALPQGVYIYTVAINKEFKKGKIIVGK